jgi:hypothetical protein
VVPGPFRWSLIRVEVRNLVHVASGREEPVSEDAHRINLETMQHRRRIVPRNTAVELPKPEVDTLVEAGVEALAKILQIRE